MEWLKEMLKKQGSTDELFELIKNEIEKRYGKDAKKNEDYEKEIESLKKEIASVKKEYAIEKEIMAQGGRNAKAVRALIEDDMLEFDEDGKLISVDIEKIKKSDPYLFKEIKNAVEGTPEDKSRRKKNEKSIFFDSAKRAAGIKC